MKKITSVFVGIVFTTVLHAQTPDWSWAKSAMGNNADDGYGITVDPDCNSYVTGSFSSSSITFGGSTLTNAGSEDMFIVKYDTSGNVIWAHSAGGSGSDVARKVASDGHGNLYVTGWFESPSVTFGTTVLNNSFTSYSDCFIVKYDSSGNVLWAKSAGGNAGEQGRCIAVDPNGNCYVAGLFYTPNMTFGTFYLNGVGGSDMFLAKYDSSGNFIWARAGGGTADEIANGIAVDANGNSYVTGHFFSTSAYFAPVTINNAGNNKEDIFVVKYNSAGTALWAQAVGGTQEEVGVDVAIDTIGNCYASCYFASPSFMFGNTTVTSAGGYDMLTLKFGPNGTKIWARTGGGTGNDNGFGISVDGSGNPYVIGSYLSSTMTLGSYTVSNPVPGFWDLYVAKYDSSGTVLWLKGVGGPADDRAYGIAAAANGDCFVTGDYNSSTIIFGADTLTGTGGLDVFTAKLGSATISSLGESHNLISPVIYPNPVSNTAVISFSLLQSQKVSLKIFDVNGRLISAVADKYFEAGANKMVWDASGINAGFYFLRLEAGTFVQTEKISVIK